MISGLGASNERFLNDYARIEQRMAKAQRQLSSGLRVTRPSDDPGQVAAILQLRADLAHNDQIKTNLGRVKTDVDTAEQALRMATDLMDSAVTIATQASGPMQNEATLATLAEQVAGLQQRMVAISATQVDGRYVFGGDQDQVPPYTLDLTAPNGVVASTLTPAATNQTEEPGGGRFQTGRTAAEVFDSPDTGVFAALDALRLALLAGDATAATQMVTTIRAASDYLNVQLSYYGATQNRVATALDAAGSTDVRLKTELVGREEADMTEAIVEFGQSQLQQQTTLKMKAQMPQTSLFDLLG